MSGHCPIGSIGKAEHLLAGWLILSALEAPKNSPRRGGSAEKGAFDSRAVGPVAARRDAGFRIEKATCRCWFVNDGELPTMGFQVS